MRKIGRFLYVLLCLLVGRDPDAVYVTHGQLAAMQYRELRAIREQLERIER